MAGEALSIIHILGGNLFSINSRVIEMSLHRYAVFYVSSTKVPMATSKYGILFSNKREAEQHFYNSFYSITGSMQGLRNTVEQISQSSFPVMISGEEEMCIRDRAPCAFLSLCPSLCFCPRRSCSGCLG